MKKQIVLVVRTITGILEPLEVGADVVEGLAVHMSIGPKNGFCVTHVASGVSLCNDELTRVQATKLRDELLADTVEWTEPLPTALKNASLRSLISLRVSPDTVRYGLDGIIERADQLQKTYDSIIGGPTKKKRSAA